jgi:hypothetical protein
MHPRLQQLRAVLQPLVQLHLVMLQVVVLQVVVLQVVVLQAVVLQAVVLAELLHLQVKAQVQLPHLRSLLQPQTPIQPPALHRAAHLVRVTDAI